MVIVFYGGLLWGALPQDGPISWQGHLFGLVGGVVAARLFVPRPVRIRVDPQ
jgi:membrane associated rhomboid family serine protease